MFKSLNLNTISPPFARYSHAIVVPEGRQIVFVSGQLGIDSRGVIPPDCESQTELCFSNISAILAEADLNLSHVVRINAYVTARAYLADYMDVRNKLFVESYPASTLVVVSGFARPEFLVEVEVVAAGS